MGRVSSLFMKLAEVSVDLLEGALGEHASVNKLCEATQTH